MTDVLEKTERWFSVSELAERFHVGRATIYGEIRRQRLRAVAVNDRGDLRMAQSWVSAWISERGRDDDRTV